MLDPVTHQPSVGQLGSWPIESESEVAQSCLTLCDPMDCSIPGSSIHGIFQARVLEWVAISFSRGSSRPRNWTQVSLIVGRCFTVWATREVQLIASQFHGWIRVQLPYRAISFWNCLISHSSKLSFTMSPSRTLAIKNFTFVCMPRGSRNNIY